VLFTLPRVHPPSVAKELGISQSEGQAWKRDAWEVVKLGGHFKSRKNNNCDFFLKFSTDIY